LNKNNKILGRIDFANIGYYEGELVNNIPNGNGVLFSNEGDIIYSGGWKNR
jgi:hypothetical protein